MTATRTKRQILKVTIRREVDTGPDLSDLGEYTSSPGADDVTINRKERGDCGRGEYEYFVAAMSGEETGNPESVEQDYRRMEDYNRGGWCMVGVWVEAEVVLTGSTVQRIRSGELWGIESDSGDDYFAEVEEEQFAELRGELEAIGFNSRAINRAIKSAERKTD